MLIAAAGAALTVALSSATARPDAQVRVTVHGLDAPAALVVLHGGIAREGRWLGWVPLLPAGPGTWSTVLTTPGLYGMYPVRLRVGRVVRSTDEVLQVVPPGFARQPGFETPQQVAQWWAWLAPPGAAVKRVRTWTTGFYTHRDRTLNRLLRVRVALLGDWRARHLRRGLHTVYLSVARERVDAPWRLLCVVPAP